MNLKNIYPNPDKFQVLSIAAKPKIPLDRSPD